MGAGPHPQGHARDARTDASERRSLAAAAYKLQAGRACGLAQRLQDRRRSAISRLQEVPHLFKNCGHGRSETVEKKNSFTANLRAGGGLLRVAYICRSSINQ